MTSPTKEQQAVIDFRSGVACVQAVAGSGKTTTLAMRSKALPSNEQKLILSFNKEASEEFQRKLGPIQGADSKTFHSFCLKQIMGNYKSFGFTKKPKIETKTWGILSQVVRKEMPHISDALLENWDNDFEQKANSSYHNSDLEEMIESGDSEADYAKALLLTRKEMLKQNILSFPCMVRLVAERTDLISEIPDHVMIDEYQDVDSFQFQVGTSLADKTESLVVVGDMNQQIYTWRGAIRDSFNVMSERFNGVVTLPLLTNFRSTEEIIEYANGVIACGMRGVGRRDKDSVEVFDGYEEAFGTDYFNSAIICRTNRECFREHIALIKKGVPNTMLSRKEFWSKRHVSLALKLRRKGVSFSKALDDKEVEAMLRTPTYKDPMNRKEAVDDIEWLLTCSDDDFNLALYSKDQNGIRISTIHKTKGMEFSNVVVQGVNDKMREESCLFYVAVTRAKNKLRLGNK